MYDPEKQGGDFGLPYKTLHEAASTPPGFFRDFKILQPELAMQKVFTLKNTPPEYLIFLYDFDKCFTREDGSIYQRISRRLPPEGRLDSDRDRLACLALERAGLLSDLAREAWTDREIDRYAQYGLTLGDIQLAMTGQDRLRPGAQRVVKSGLAVGARRIGFISQGLEDAMKCTDLPWENTSLEIRSNRLLYDARGRILGRSGDIQVNGNNKDQYALELLEASGIPPDKCMAIVMGDSFHDANMMPEGKLPFGQVLRVCVPPHPDVDQEFLHKALTPKATQYPPYDMVLAGTESLDSVAEMIEWAAV
ncbi:MAG: hypothetical protein ACREBW_10170 [Candidatus Micrarchaeaceae archaeon]